jgi:hypothetical protein
MLEQVEPAPVCVVSIGIAGATADRCERRNEVGTRKLVCRSIAQETDARREQRADERSKRGLHVHAVRRDRVFIFR